MAAFVVAESASVLRDLKVSKCDGKDIIHIFLLMSSFIHKVMKTIHVNIETIQYVLEVLRHVLCCKTSNTDLTMCCTLSLSLFCLEYRLHPVL